MIIRKIFLCMLMPWGLAASAQKSYYDIVTYREPKNWKKEMLNSLVAYSRIDGGSWAQMCIYKCNASTGTIQGDIDAEWQSLVLSQHTITDKDEKGEPQTAGKWTVMSRSGIWQYNGSNVATILTTYSNGAVCISTLLNATAQPYMNDYKKLLASLSINEAAANKYIKPADAHGPQQTIPSTTGQTSYTFSTTNFDDGWVSSVKDEWVEVSKPFINILIHYPNPKTDEYQSEKSTGDQNAWNILVAPRYTNIQNLRDRGIQDYQSTTFLTADATDRQTGKKVFVVLFKKHYDKGNGRYLEVVAGSRQTFEKEFGSNYIDQSSWDHLEQTKSWDRLAGMQWRNKFSVAITDLAGKWSSSSYGSLRYYYVNGGGFAGATATSIADEFTFFGNSKYESDHSGASGVVGAQQFARQVYKGDVQIENWNITLTNRFQGATERYESYFEAIKGGRILILTDKNNTTLTLVKAR